MSLRRLFGVLATPTRLTEPGTKTLAQTADRLVERFERVSRAALVPVKRLGDSFLNGKLIQ
jgi:hypothetical protein